MAPGSTNSSPAKSPPRTPSSSQPHRWQAAWPQGQAGACSSWSVQEAWLVEPTLRSPPCDASARSAQRVPQRTSSPILPKTRVASAKDGGGGPVRRGSIYGAFYRRVVGFGCSVPAPAVKRVIDYHALFELRQNRHPRWRKSRARQRAARRLRLEVQARRVGTTNDSCQVQQRGSERLEFRYQRVEAAFLTAMRVMHVLYVERDRSGFVGDVLHLFCRDEMEHGKGSMKPADKPGQAMPSIFGRWRVTQTLCVGRPVSRPGASR